MPTSSLPLPTAEAATHSQRLTSHIVQIINDANGATSFAEFMALALYATSLGYYSSSARKFGAGGDFATAPEISPLFSPCLAKPCQPILTHLSQGIILEFGAGSGIMAADILKELARLDCLPTPYLILEVRAELQQRQRITLQARVPELLVHLTQSTSEPRITRIKPSSAPRLRPWLVKLELTPRKVGETRRHRRHWRHRRFK